MLLDPNLQGPVRVTLTWVLIYNVPRPYLGEFLEILLFPPWRSKTFRKISHKLKVRSLGLKGYQGGGAKMVYVSLIEFFLGWDLGVWGLGLTILPEQIGVGVPPPLLKK